MSIEENKEVVRRFVEEFWNQRHMAAADELMTADATIVLPGRGQVNKESFKAFALTLRSAFPDWHSTPEEPHRRRWKRCRALDRARYPPGRVPGDLTYR